MILQRIMAETVVILGASINPDRYSYKTQLALMEKGHTPVPVNPRYDQIDGIQCYPELKSLERNIDTITIYVKPAILRSMTEDIVHLRPRRVIFNPGAECQEVSARLESAGIKVQNACTLVLLNTSQFTK
jgi:predicted CoA-binding protein